MKRYINKHFTDILYAIAGVGMALIIFLLFMLNIKTDNTVLRIHDNLLVLQKHIETDHDDQDRLLSCLVDLFANEQHPSSDQLNGCVAKTRIGQDQPATTGTSPASQAAGPSTSPSISPGSSSSPQSAPLSSGAQSNTSPVPQSNGGIPIITPIVEFVKNIL